MSFRLNTQQNTGVLPSEEDKVAAEHLRDVMEFHPNGDSVLRFLDKHEKVTKIRLSKALAGVLVELLDYVEQGKLVELKPLGEELTMQQAAGVLNVSRSDLDRLLKDGKISPRVVEGRRRISVLELCDFRKRNASACIKALSELAEVDGKAI